MNALIPPVQATLSKRQQEILQAACDGVADKVIAASLGVSPRTLEGHWRAIHQKLGTANRCQAGFLYAGMRDSRGVATPVIVRSSVAAPDHTQLE